MHERASRPRHRRWTVRRTTTTTTKMAPTTTKMALMDRRRRRSTARECAPDGDASPARLDVDDILDSLMSSQVRSRLLAAALEYSVEATMNDFPGANTDARGPPVAAAYLRGFLRKNLGANLHIDRHVSPSPTHALLASLPPERPGGGTWTDDDVNRVAAGLRSLMLARLDLRIRALDLHGTRVLLRGRDTNLVTSAAASWSHSGARRRRADAGAPPPPAVELREALAAGDDAFAARVAEAHGARRAAAARGGGCGDGGGAGAAREGEGEPPVLTADDVLRTLQNLANPSPNPPAVAPSASPCTYDRGFMDSRFADDALP